MHVIGDDHRHVEFFADLDQPLIDDLLIGNAVLHELKIKIAFADSYQQSMGIEFGDADGETMDEYELRIDPKREFA